MRVLSCHRSMFPCTSRWSSSISSIDGVCFEHVQKKRQHSNRSKNYHGVRWRCHRVGTALVALVVGTALNSALETFFLTVSNAVRAP